MSTPRRRKPPSSSSSSSSPSKSLKFPSSPPKTVLNEPDSPLYALADALPGPLSQLARYAANLLVNRAYFDQLAMLLLVWEAILCAVVIWKVPCGLDWEGEMTRGKLKVDARTVFVFLSLSTMFKRHGNRLDSIHARSLRFSFGRTRLHKAQRRHGTVGLPSGFRVSLFGTLLDYRKRRESVDGTMGICWTLFGVVGGGYVEYEGVESCGCLTKAVLGQRPYTV